MVAVMYMNDSVRKQNRLQEYNYATAGAYFITICTKDRAEILSKIRIVGEGLCALPQHTGDSRIVRKRCVVNAAPYIRNTLRLCSM